MTNGPAAGGQATYGQGELPGNGGDPSTSPGRRVNAQLLRDGAGALLLLASLFQSWSLDHPAGWPVSVLAILAAFGIPVLHHLGRLTGATATPPTRVLLIPAVPLALLMLFSTVREVTRYDLVGSGMVLAGCGTLLALQAALAVSPGRARVWMRAGLGLLGVSALWAVMVVVRALANHGLDVGIDILVVLVSIALYGVGLPGWLMQRTANRRSADWAAGVLLAVALILGLMTAGSTPVTLFVAGLAMGLTALSDTSVAPGMQPPLVGPNRWLLPAVGMVTLSSLVFGYLAIASLLGLIAGSSRSAGVAVTLVMSVGMAVLGFACRGHADRGSTQTRMMMLVWAACLLVLVLVNMAWSSRVHVGGPVSMGFVTLVLPFAIAAAVTVPPSVRKSGPLQR